MSVNETKNTTILAMDVVGYSAKMNEDETGTTEKLINTMLEGMKMWNGVIAFQEYIKFELENNYGYNELNFDDFKF